MGCAGLDVGGVGLDAVNGASFLTWTGEGSSSFFSLGYVGSG